MFVVKVPRGLLPLIRNLRFFIRTDRTANFKTPLLYTMAGLWNCMIGRFVRPIPMVSGAPTRYQDSEGHRPFLIASPLEDAKIRRSKQCTQEGVMRAGVKAAGIACICSAVPTLVAVRTIPWAKAHLNYTAQALVISSASIAAYFITADKTILECARRNTHYDKTT